MNPLVLGATINSALFLVGVYLFALVENNRRAIIVILLACALAFLSHCHQMIRPHSSRQSWALIIASWALALAALALL